MNVIQRNTPALVSLTALTASTDTPIAWDESDEKIVMVIVSSSTSDTTLTVKAGNGIQGVADLTVTVSKGTSLLKLESGFYKNVSGANKGKIVINSPTALSVGVCAMI